MNQDYPSLEILVLDNCSTDQTAEVIRQVAAGDTRVRYICHQENIGMARNFNAGIAASSGELMQIVCADDVLLAGSVTLLASAMLRHPRAVLATGARISADEALRSIGVLRPSSRLREIDASELVRECVAHGNKIGEPSAVMFRRAAAERGFNQEYSQAIDLEMWFHLLAQGSAVLIGETVCRIRHHEAQLTQANIRVGRIVEDKRRLFNHYGFRGMRSLAQWEKLAWDARMASSVARSRALGGTVDSVRITEVFFAKLFRYLILPLVGVIWTVRGTANHQRL